MDRNPVGASECFLGFICNCLSYFITVRITFTCILYPQCTHMSFITYSSNRIMIRKKMTRKGDNIWERCILPFTSCCSNFQSDQTRSISCTYRPEQRHWKIWLSRYHYYYHHHHHHYPTTTTTTIVVLFLLLIFYSYFYSAMSLWLIEKILRLQWNSNPWPLRYWHDALLTMKPCW